MGLYSTLIVTMPCARCGAPRPETPVQFKTVDDRKLPTYRGGDLVPALAVDSPYEGIGDAYCVECARRFDDDTIDTVGRAIDTGVVIARFYDQRPTPPVIEPRGGPLGGDEVARTLRAQLLALPCSLILPNRLEDAGIALYRGAERMYPLDDGNSLPALAWWHDHVDEALRARGWPFGQWDSREDIEVIVDSRGELRLHVPDQYPGRDPSPETLPVRVDWVH